ncbi:MAG: hypothetical protein MUE33_05925 [Cytophagaceae bacterium]|jgi:hypothetical protein|nr:hypothetical protein [Cytophagaceae bacterium]
MEFSQNDPELDGKYLGTISKDFILVSDVLKEASYQLRVRQISKYPIFPVCRVEQPIGQLLIPQAHHSNEWLYYFSMADEFIQRGLIDSDKIEAFEMTYKDPEEFCCLFIIDKTFTNFVFIPYPED